MMLWIGMFATLGALPVKVLYKNSTASVTLGAGAEVHAGGSVALQALTEANATGVAGGILVQLCLGAIYAWSLFTKPLTAPDGPYGFTAGQAPHQTVDAVTMAPVQHLESSAIAFDGLFNQAGLETTLVDQADSLVWGKLLLASGTYYLVWCVFERRWAAWAAAP